MQMQFVKILFLLLFPITCFALSEEEIVTSVQESLQKADERNSSLPASSSKLHHLLCNLSQEKTSLFVSSSSYSEVPHFHMANAKFETFIHLFLKNSVKCLPQMDEEVFFFFYDGNHSSLHQELAFKYFNDVFADVFIVVVSDWNWRDVQIGTRRAFRALKYKVLFEATLQGARWEGDTEMYENGVYLAVIRKN